MSCRGTIGGGARGSTVQRSAELRVPIRRWPLGRILKFSRRVPLGKRRSSWTLTLTAGVLLDVGGDYGVGLVKMRGSSPVVRKVRR